MRTVCVFSGSSAGTRPEYAETARALGRELARRGLRLVYGGASVGLMGEVADAVLGSGGEAVGVIPQHLMEREIGHTGLTELHVRGSMHDRKALMAELSDGFVALPGGFGTLEEFAEVVTWCQLGLHSKPCALLDVAGFYQPLLMFLDHAATEGFIGAESRQLVLAGSDPVALLDALESWVPRRVDKWSSRVVPVAPGPAG